MVGGDLVRDSPVCVPWMSVGWSSSLGRVIVHHIRVMGGFVLVSRMYLTEQYRDNDHFLRSVSSSRHETMVDGVLTRTSEVCVGLGVIGDTIVSEVVLSPITFVDFSLVDLIFISRYFEFVLSYNPVYVRYVDSSTLTFVSHRTVPHS